MEIASDANWYLWTICFDMIRYGETFRPQPICWQYLDYAVDMSETENEDNIDKDSNDTTS
jgi:hypothetical protein